MVKELKAQKPLVQAYVMDEIFDKMIGGEAAVGVYYSGDAITMIDDNPDLAWVFPAEGSVLYIGCCNQLKEVTIGTNCFTEFTMLRVEGLGGWRI